MPKSLINRIISTFDFRTRRLKKQYLEESDTFCMAPWVHLHMSPHGKVYPCCISAHYVEESPGQLKDNDLVEIWNSEKMKAIRRNMMDGTGNKLCGLCYEYEKIGKKSTREVFNEEFEAYFPRVSWHTKDDGTARKFKLKYIDFRFSNLCNFKCRICSYYFSTSWYQEAVKLGQISEDDSRLIVPLENQEQLWRQILPTLPYLDKIHFAGGEPLIMEEHYRILKYFLDRGKTDVMLTYNTNFSETRYKDADAITMWSRFKHVTVHASLDGMGKRGEYMRKGQKWEQVVENRKRMIRECPHVEFVLSPAVSIMNVLHLPDFYREWVEQGLVSPKGMNIYLVFEPHFYNIQELPDAFKRRVEEVYRRFDEEFLSNFDNETYDYISDQFNQVIRHMNSSEKFQPTLDEFMGYNFQTYNKRLDDMRREDLLDTFPELEPLYESIQNGL